MESPGDNSHILSSPSSTGSRKRSRDNETPSQRAKREKAAERQRRKRERDKSLGIGVGVVGFPPIMDLDGHHQIPSQEYATPYVSRQQMEDDLLTPEEKLRRDRVRAAARERQRKHRAIIKARKMHALELEMGTTNPVLPSIEDSQFRPPADYQAVLPPELHHVVAQQAATAAAAATIGMHSEPPFPQGQTRGQTFATTLLLSFSCAPILKQHLLRTLNMTNEELASLEPIIADAWDQWDHQVSLCF
jgi:hypothetical protein